jgi:hypothetical protein
MYPLAKRALLAGRDYSARSPVVQAMTLGQADYHTTKPWMLEQDPQIDGGICNDVDGCDVVIVGAASSAGQTAPHLRSERAGSCGNPAGPCPERRLRGAGLAGRVNAVVGADRAGTGGRED